MERGNSDHMSSSSSSLHRLPTSAILSSSASSIVSLPISPGSNLVFSSSAAAKKFRAIGAKDLPPEPKIRSAHASVDGPEGGHGLKASASEAILTKNSIGSLFSPTSKKSFFSWLGKGKTSGKLPQQQQQPKLESSELEVLLPFHPQSLESLVAPLGSEVEIEVKIVRHGRYDLDGQCFGLADNREPPRLPWHRDRQDASESPVFHSGP